MNVIGKLLAAPVLQQRNFTGRDGAAQVFNFRTIVLNCGTDSLAGEMMGETAVRWPHQHLLESTKIRDVYRKRKLIKMLYIIFGTVAVLGVAAIIILNIL